MQVVAEFQLRSPALKELRVMEILFCTEAERMFSILIAACSRGGSWDPWRDREFNAGFKDDGSSIARSVTIISDGWEFLMMSFCFKKISERRRISMLWSVRNGEVSVFWFLILFEFQWHIVRKELWWVAISLIMW